MNNLMVSPIVVTGMHRSGTTVMGKVIGKIVNPSVTLYEPLNYELGVRNMPIWYPYLPPVGGDQEYETILNKVITTGGDYRRSARLENEPINRSLRRFILGSKGWRSSIYSKIFWKNREHIFKDPFMVLLSGYLAEKIDAKIIIMVRHPVALYKSIKRMKWVFDLDHILDQKKLNDDFPLLLSDIPDDLKSLDVQVGILWRVIYGAVDEIKSQYPDNILLIRHEDFCLDPHRVCLDLGNFLGELGQQVRSENFIHFINGITQSEKIIGASGKVHDFRRNSAKLALYWREDASSEVFNRLHELVGKVYYKYYGAWDKL